MLSPLFLFQFEFSFRNKNYIKKQEVREKESTWFYFYLFLKQTVLRANIERVYKTKPGQISKSKKEIKN